MKDQKKVECPGCHSLSYIMLRVKPSPAKRGLDRWYMRCRHCGEEYVALRDKKALTNREVE